MPKGRKTDLNERIQIVLFCLKNDNNYQLTADTYQVSYQQVYQWVKKYDASDETSLQDNRGRNKVEHERTMEEQLKIEMQQLERENERLRTENALLKKLEELEGRRIIS